jgi:predicted ester cyclase
MTRFFLVLAVIAIAQPPCLADESQNVAAVKAMIAAINDRDLDALDAVVSENVVRHSAATPNVVVTSLQEFREFLNGDLTTFPDAQQEIDIIFGSGDYVAIRATLIGTQSGPMGPFPASNSKMELPFMGILRVEGGKIAEMWVEWDNLNALVQLGHFPLADQSEN